MTAILDELRQALGDDAVLSAEAAAQRASSYWDPAPLRARALVRPRSTEEASAVLRLCHAAGQPVVIHGGLTGVCEGDRSTANDIVISLERMNRIEEIDPVGRTATVLAGCTLQALQEAARDAGLLFPLDLGARGSCTIGGNLATNAGGTNVIRYGMARAHVLGLEAVLADGTIVSSMNRMLKNNAGYDLKQLFIGSEGTLGLITRVVVSLRETLPVVNTVLCALDHEEALLDLLRAADRKLGGMMSSFEAMWGDYYRAVTAPGWHRSPIERNHAAYVIIEASSAAGVLDEERIGSVVAELHQAGLVADAVLPKSDAERAGIWAIREDFEALRRLEPLFLYDVSVPLQHMQHYVSGVRADLDSAWPDGHCFTMGHLGDGNLHFFVHPGSAGGEPLQLQEQSDQVVYGRLVPFGGSVSAEHGIGLSKKRWLGHSRTPQEMALMWTLKKAQDPGNILNPGKVL